MDKETANAISKLERKIDSIENMIKEIHREVGASSGSKMAEQVDRLFQEKDKGIQKLNEIERSVIATRKLIEYGDKDIKEIKQALALIYKNTDELENNLMGDTRVTS